ncbi:stAR-related lipid transfer protein 9-like [Gouania willdenowi]|uniref:stAR-related lipid transfer protein 9-like n=1 Tax=Gouania willdenowi TaxID=441366 RepID=UPI00105484D1|nr:stAR-related lipid transfer protein 9-like [Gouania willdenowi]
MNFFTFTTFRHRSSIEGLRQQREERLQECRRAPSLSPSKHHHLSSCKTPAESTLSPCEENPQPLHQESSKIPEPPKDAHYPSDIEQLLRDYGRAREEAQTEIAKARDRLRERTEMEKRRLQDARDEPRHRTRSSYSTLCTGSSLSLSSAPTSGYNSGNITRQHHSNRATATATGQVSGLDGLDGLDEGLKVRTRPPICGLHSVKTQESCLSAQDVNQQCPVSKQVLTPLMTSSPSAFLGSSSSLSTAISSSHPVRWASSGDLNNLMMGKASAGWRFQGEERGIQAYYKSSLSPSVHSFLGVGELDRPLDSLWNVVRQLSKSHMYNPFIRSMWTRPLDDSTQLAYILSDPSTCNLSQPRDFCCISTESKQGGVCVLAMQSVCEETLPRPSADAVRGEMMPSCWMFQPIGNKGATRVIYMLQLDLVSPSFPHRLLNTVSRRQAAVVANLDVFLAS